MRLSGYPWGNSPGPGARLYGRMRELRTAMRRASTEGFAELPGRVRRVVAVTREFVEALEYAARSGLVHRPREGGVPGRELMEHARAVHEAVAALGDASIGTLTERYSDFVETLERAMALTERAREEGVTPHAEAMPLDLRVAFSP